jgi:prolipoprotein diacylglyceryltransferase
VLGLLRRTSERITNSWREWRVGPLRIINYAGYTFIAAWLGMTVLVACAGTDLLWDAVIVALAALIGAAAWGQYWVGSRSLLRPFGYFGSVLGASVGMGVVWLTRGNSTDAVWRLCAGAAMCAPWVQSIGRLRCLVNGCCHGKECAPEIGIRCTSPRSRIVRLSGLADRPIHPTPLYSILANMVIGMLLIAMWRVGAPAPQLTGTYLIGQGLARFVEEHYRGEPHTPVHAGLRLYQWFALGSFVSGMTVAAIPTAVVAPSPTLSMTTVLIGAAVGIVYAFAMGMDFPASNRRFSRLA